MKTKESVFDMPSNRLLSTKQASEFTGLSVGHIYNLKASGVLKPYKVGPGKNSSLRFEKAYLEKFMGNHYGNKKIIQ
jgi:excisionase family DNA binding protein